MKAFIGIIHFGQDHLLYSLLKSLKTKDNDYICIVNHNRSNSLKGISDKVEIIHDPRNLGFAIGTNFLVRKAIKLKYDQYIGMNNDMILLNDSLCLLKQQIKSSKVVQGTLVDENGLILLCRNQLNENFFWVNSKDRHKKVEDVKDYDTDFICAGLFGIDLTSFKLNPVYFDEEFFMYHEDVEWSIRLKKAGYKLSVLTNVLAIHYESSATGGKISWLGIQYRFASLLVLLKKMDRSPLYNILSILLFMLRMAFVWIKYGFRLK